MSKKIFTVDEEVLPLFYLQNKLKVVIYNKHMFARMCV